MEASGEPSNEDAGAGGAQVPAPAVEKPVSNGPVDFYCSYRELDSNGYSDRDMASKLAGALQKETGLDGKPINVYAPNGESWEARHDRGLRNSQHILLIVSDDGLRQIRNADRGEDMLLLEFEYALSQKMKGNKKVMLLLLKNEDGSNFSSFDTSVYPGGEVTKICQPPCHKSKRSAAMWDNGAKGDLLRKNAKPGEHSIQDVMTALYGLQGVNISPRSADIKKVMPLVLAMLRMHEPEVPTARMSPSKNVKVSEDLDKLTTILSPLGRDLIEVGPLIRSKFGITSIKDMAGLEPSSLEEPLEIDRGRVMLFDGTRQKMWISNNIVFCDTEVKANIIRKLSLLGLGDDALPKPTDVWHQVIETSGLKTRSGIGLLGKSIKVGGETRIITKCYPSLVMRTDADSDNFVAFTEITDELAAKAKSLRDKGSPMDIPPGRPALYHKLELDKPWSGENSSFFKGVMRDLTNCKETVEYMVQMTIAKDTISSIYKVTQTALGVPPGCVSLAQTYGGLFQHRVKQSEEAVDDTFALMSCIKAQDSDGVHRLLDKGVSVNFKDAQGWTPLQRACSIRIDTGDLGRNYIACNEIVESLIENGADCTQVNSYGRTALHYAAMEGNLYACTLLVRAGAPPDAKDTVPVPDPLGGGIVTGATALFHARLMKRNEWEKVVQLLQLYTDEPPPPAKPEKKGKKKGKGKKKT